MAKEETNKWTRERSFWEIHGGDLLMVATAVFFFALTLGGVAFIIFQPRVAGLHELFSDPPPPPAADQKLHLAPGETEMKLYDLPVQKPPEKKK